MCYLLELFHLLGTKFCVGLAYIFEEPIFIFYLIGQTFCKTQKQSTAENQMKCTAEGRS